MKINPAESPAMTMAKIGTAVQAKGLQQAKIEGKAAIDLIENAGVNMPLSEGDVGRTINVAI